MRIIFLCLLVLSFVNCSNINKQVEDKLKSELENIIKEVDIPGINLAIVSSDEVITVSAGYSDKEKEILMKPEDIMFSGSTGKTFCAALILQLVDEGELTLDDFISKYFKDEVWFSRIPNANEITIRMLLNHTTGLPRYAFDDRIWKALKENPDKTWTGEERLSFIYDMDPIHPAGKGWAYSDTNYILLGMLIEKLTDNEYYEELSKRILVPNQLAKTYAGNSREIPGLVPGYSAHSDAFFIPEKVVLEDGKFAFNPQMEFTGGGIACTALDLAKWGAMYYGGEIFSEESKNEMIKPCDQKTDLADGAGYGFAAFVWNDNNRISYGHTGFFPGYVTIIEYVPDLKVSIAMQWNTDKKSTDKSLHQHINDIKKVLEN